uniref:SCP domain-containing protein n=3 Tax=Lygus hesperus TaxID=30085 RepID=A0A0K8T3W2_LYGHE
MVRRRSKRRSQLSKTRHFSADPESDVEQWWSGMRTMVPGKIDSFFAFQPSQHHFSQMIWANTERIGCATVAYRLTTGIPCPFLRFTVCNYGPGGNQNERPIYEEGPPCSNCPNGDCVCGDSPLILRSPSGHFTSAVRKLSKKNKRKKEKELQNQSYRAMKKKKKKKKLNKNHGNSGFKPKPIIYSPVFRNSSITGPARRSYTREFWCSEEMKCQNEFPPEHTMCRFFDVDGTPRCSRIVNRITDCDREKILRRHNVYRRQIAMGEVPGWPAAANMKLLTYDQTLEDIAHRWAIQCLEGHDKCRKTEKWWSVGQNIAKEYGHQPMLKTNPEYDVDAWFNELGDSNPNIVDEFYVQVSKRPTGHFLQLVWADSEKVGCAMVSYKMNSSSQYPYVRATVCNYGPTGNVISYPVYQRGDPCSKCPIGAKCVCDFQPATIKACNETGLRNFDSSINQHFDFKYPVSRDNRAWSESMVAEEPYSTQEEVSSMLRYPSVPQNRPRNIVVPDQTLFIYPPLHRKYSSAWQNQVTPLRTADDGHSYCSNHHEDLKPPFVVGYDQPSAVFVSDLPLVRPDWIIHTQAGEEYFGSEDEFQGSGQVVEQEFLSDDMLKVRTNAMNESSEIDENFKAPADVGSEDRFELEREITGIHHHLAATTRSDATEEQYKDLLVVTDDGQHTAEFSTPLNETPRMRDDEGNTKNNNGKPSQVSPYTY